MFEGECKDARVEELRGRYDSKIESVYVETTRDNKTAWLEGDFHIDELKALVAFMESKP